MCTLIFLRMICQFPNKYIDILMGISVKTWEGFSLIIQYVSIPLHLHVSVPLLVVVCYIFICLFFQIAIHVRFVVSIKLFKRWYHVTINSTLYYKNNDYYWPINCPINYFVNFCLCVAVSLMYIPHCICHYIKLIRQGNAT